MTLLRQCEGVGDVGPDEGQSRPNEKVHACHHAFAYLLGWVLLRMVKDVLLSLIRLAFSSLLMSQP